MRSFLILIAVIQAALLCAGQFEDKIDYSSIKLRKVNTATQPEPAAEPVQSSADDGDNKARVANIWGVKLRPVKKQQQQEQPEAVKEETPILAEALLPKPAARLHPVVHSEDVKEDQLEAPVEEVSTQQHSEPEVVQSSDPELKLDAEPQPEPELASEPEQVKGEQEEEVSQQIEPSVQDKAVDELSGNDDDDSDSDSDDEDDYWPLKAAMRRQGKD